MARCLTERRAKLGAAFPITPVGFLAVALGQEVSIKKSTVKRRLLINEKLEPVVGIEPTTDGLQNRCSTTELHWLEGLGGTAPPTAPHANLRPGSSRRRP